MPRLRFIDYRYSRAPKVLGFCNDDRANLASYVNSAQRRLLLAREAGDEGWWGTWAELAFANVSRSNPCITCPRGIARLEKINVCSYPVTVQNQFYEYLNFGNGRLPKTCATNSYCGCNPQALTRNDTVLFVDPTIQPFYVRVYNADVGDSNASRRVLIQGLDENDEVVYTQDIEQQVQGEFVTIKSPFVQTTTKFNRITGIQKDATAGNIQIFQVDPSTGALKILLTMEPSELVSGYRRYYLSDLPANCCSCNGTESTVTLTAIAKLDLIPVTVDTDYLLLQNIEALIEESIAIRMSEMENAESQKLSLIHHVNAIRYLNSEISHYLGKQSPAVNFAPFGTARLESQKIGSLM